MANEKQLRILKEEGVEAWKNVVAWNKWREANPDVEIDLHGANLSDANLYGANLCKAKLSKANLNNAKLYSVNLKNADLEDAKLRNAKLKNANLSGANLTGANLEDADLQEANLFNTNLIETNLFNTNLKNAYLFNANLSGANLTGANLSGANLELAVLSHAKFKNANLSGANLRAARLDFFDLNFLRGGYFRDAKLIDASLKGVNNLAISENLDKNTREIVEIAQKIHLRRHEIENEMENRYAGHYTISFEGANLDSVNLEFAIISGANFKNANLKNAYLNKVQALETNFSGANLTGACIEDWHINSETNLENVICDYIYLKKRLKLNRDKGESDYDFLERRPADPKRNFEPGEFAKLVEQSIETVDLIFKNGIDWRAFLTSFQDLRFEYGEQNVSIQAIEKKQDGAFVIRLSVPPEADKAEIESKAKQSYETKLQVLKAENRLLLKQNASLENIVNTLASRPINPINVEATAVSGERNINTGGGEYRETTLHDDSRYIETRDSSTYYENYNSPQEKTLAEAADEIQKLLKQLEQSNPTATVEQQQAYVDAAIPPTLKQRCVGALKAAGDTAIEEFLQRPGVKVVASGVRGWMLPD